MRRYDGDLIPVLAILAGGSVGAMGTMLLVPAVPDPVTAPPAVERIRPAPAPSTIGLTAEEAIDVVDHLVSEQREIRRMVGELPRERTVERMRSIEAIRERKKDMNSTILGLRRDLENASEATRFGDTLLSHTFADAAHFIRESGLMEALLYSMGTVEEWDRRSADQMEDNIATRLEELRRTLIAVTPTFTPFSVAPSILNRDEIVRVMAESYPAFLRDAGIGGTVRVYFFIDDRGRVQDTRIDASSGHPALDRAALAVADVYRFSPALNRDRAVPVWVSFPVTFEVR